MTVQLLWLMMTMMVVMATNSDVESYIIDTDENSTLFQKNYHDDQHHHHLNYHGYLMLISWTVLIPCGIICFKLLSHRDDDDDPTKNKYVGFRIHEGLNILGVLLAIVGYVLAIIEHYHHHHHQQQHDDIDPFHDENVYSNDTTTTTEATTVPLKTSPAATVEFKLLSKKYHKILGHVVMIGAILNVLLFGLGVMKSPTNSSYHAMPRNEWPMYQRIGSGVHKLLGYVLFLGGYVVCFLGYYNMEMSTKTTSSNTNGNNDDHNNFFRVMVTNILISVVFTFVCWYDKVKYNKQQKLNNNNNNDGIVAINETTQLILTPTQAEI